MQFQMHLLISIFQQVLTEHQSIVHPKLDFTRCKVNQVCEAYKFAKDVRVLTNDQQQNICGCHCICM